MLLATWVWCQSHSYLYVSGLQGSNGTAIVINRWRLFIIRADRWPDTQRVSIHSKEHLSLAAYDDFRYSSEIGLKDVKFAYGPMMVVGCSPWGGNCYGSRILPRRLKYGIDQQMAGNGWSLNIPFLQAASFTAFIPILWLILKLFQVRRSRSMRRVGLCPSCGYDLRATPKFCPECGSIPPPIPTALLESCT